MLWAAYQNQWSEVGKFAIMLGLLKVDPNKHKNLAILLLMFLSSCKSHYDFSLGKSDYTPPPVPAYDGLILNPHTNTQIPSGSAGIWVNNNGIPILQSSDSKQWTAGEASYIKNCNSVSGTSGAICFDFALGQTRIFYNSWHTVPFDDIALVHITGTETLTGRKTFPGGLSAPIIPSILAGTGTQVTGHVVPNIADDTFALLLATQELRNKTINATYNTITGIPLSTRNLIAGAGLTGGGDLSADRTFNVVANADASIVVNANDIQVGVISDAQHGSRSGGAAHSVAVASGSNGFLSGTDKAKLDGIAASATNTPLSSGTPANIGTAAAGSSSSASKADHVHALPSVGPGAGTYCNATAVKDITLDANGRITNITCL